MRDWRPTITLGDNGDTLQIGPVVDPAALMDMTSMDVGP
jgi:hypothetical protein